MKGLRAWFATPGGRQFFNIIYSLGAAVVIIGALFKIIHVSWGNIVFVIGMSMEAAIFLLSAFDTSYTESSPATGTGSGYIVAGGSGAAGTTGSEATVSGSVKTVHPSTGGGTGGGSSVIVVGGGGTSAGSGSVAATSGEAAATTATQGTPVSGTASQQAPIIVGGAGSGSGASVSGGGSAVAGSGAAVGGGAVAAANIPAEEYASSATNAAQSLEDFSTTMKSLNETSQTILNAYKEIAETQNLGEAMNTVRYINDSLSRIKNLYDGAIGDSYMFKEEMSKMTRHIEALNQVYARLLQAMTMNNPNNNNFPQNPPY
ncbi:gliding motility protein GldL [Dysgonomonas sp. 25]|uniref:GldL-related protein n=1 Tax=Dysgonomonas sp. 25 TaxID=2302933 RepID=UPI0013D03456|nr:gliding motility protein GldL [Dysgonomonas sp. 25]NDV68013.1 gliding motility protein GldL [Dysgonomonas sp. 25]